MTNTTPPLQIILHAPTAQALARARSNAANIIKESAQTVVRIVVNADAVTAALDTPNAAQDPITFVCANTLNKLQRTAPAPFVTLPGGAALAIARMQQEGWCYIRA
ncbi:MAG: hypothetical protein P4L87_16945 [Formivibrio sp.]|nr:hypothetical protein [Formivibrio sp.]